MQGGFQSVWDKVVSDIPTDYYLIFGKQTDQSGIYTKFWVDIKLPEIDIFECYTPQHRLFITNKIKTIADEAYTNLERSPFRYAEVEKIAMDSLTAIISKAKLCCLPSNGLRMNPLSCTPCPDDIQFIESLFESYGFNSIDVDSMQTSFKSDTAGIVHENTEMTVTIDGESINVNQDIKSFLDKLGSKIEGVHGEIWFYDYSTFECLDILASVLGEEFEDLPSLKGNGTSKNRSSSSSDNLYEVIVIGVTDNSGSSKLYIRTKTNYSPSSSGKTIYLQSLDGCCLDMNLVKDKVINFYTLLGDYIITENYQKDTFSLVPNVEISTFLPKEQVKDNTIVLFGEGSQLIDMAQGYYSDISGNWANESDDKESICRFLSSDGLLEMGQNPGNISLVRTELEDYLDDFKCETKEELASFLCFHATGHNAGIGHFTNTQFGQSPYMSYMSEGCCISKHYLSKLVPCSYCSLGDSNYPNLETFVSETVNDQYRSFDSRIKAKIYERYIK